MSAWDHTSSLCSLEVTVLRVFQYYQANDIRVFVQHMHALIKDSLLLFEFLQTSGEMLE